MNVHPINRNGVHEYGLNRREKKTVGNASEKNEKKREVAEFI